MIQPRPRRHARLPILLFSVCAALAARGGPQAPGNIVPASAVKSPEEMFAATKAAEAKGLLTLGTTLTDRKDFSAAEIAYRQILSTTNFTRPQQKDALLGLARTYRLEGSYTKAAAIDEKFIKEFADDPRMPDTLLDLGRTLRAMGADRMAINAFYSVINSTLKLPTEGFEHYELLAKTAQFEIAETYFAEGNYAEAGKFFGRLRLLDLAPADRARAHFMSAYSQVLGGDLEGAVTTLRSYLDQWPKDENNPEARSLLATTLRRLKRPDEALSVTLDLLRHEQAASEANPKSWAYWQRKTGNQLANEFFQEGDTINALAIYQGLASLAPDAEWRLPITYQIALCYERLRLPERARTSYQAIIDAVAAAKTGATPDMNELAHMAGWRLANLKWTEHAESALTAFFATTTGQATNHLSKISPDDSNGSPATAPAVVR